MSLLCKDKNNLYEEEQGMKKRLLGVLLAVMLVASLVIIGASADVSTSGVYRTAGYDSAVLPAMLLTSRLQTRSIRLTEHTATLTERRLISLPEIILMSLSSRGRLSTREAARYITTCRGHRRRGGLEMRIRLIFLISHRT